jgi:hypothetical protein
MIYELGKICRLALETGKKNTLERVDKLSKPRKGEKLKLIWNWTVFDWDKGKEGYGEIENDGIQTKPPSKAFPSMSWKNGKLTFGDLSKADMGCSIAMTLVLDKKVNIQKPANMDTGPTHRIAFGQRSDNSLIVVTEENITTQSLAEKMLSYGCANAFQGDCGDSVGVYDGKKLTDHGRAIAGAIAAYEIDVDYWLEFRNKWQNRIYPDLAYAISYMAYKKSKKAKCTSGFRSAEEQLASQKYALIQHKNYTQLSDGRVYNSKGQCMVSAVGESSHNWGMAFDSAGTWIEKMTDAELRTYGLCKPMSYEPWHIELIKRYTLEQKKNLFYKYMGGYPMDAKTFQMITGLKPDGVVGKLTLAKMKEVKELINKHVKG